MALGPIVLGYAHPKVNEAIRRQLEKGSLASLQSPLEVAVAEKLVEHVPCAEMVRFMKSGAEATAVAVRIARGYTGREKVISCGYAGWHDWWVAKASSTNSRGAMPQTGVPEALKSLAFDLAYGDTSRLQALAAEHGDDIACIMIDTSEVNDNGDFLRHARKMADAMGTVLVFDEIITGFRMGLSGAQGVYGVTPIWPRSAKPLRTACLFRPRLDGGISWRRLPGCGYRARSAERPFHLRPQWPRSRSSRSRRLLSGCAMQARRWRKASRALHTGVRESSLSDSFPCRGSASQTGGSQ